MPTISPQVRASIGSSNVDIPMPRQQIKVSTGMNISNPNSNLAPQPDKKLGQVGNIEETQAKAVTLSPQLTLLARKQQKLQQEIQAQRDKEAAWATEKADFVPRSAFKARFEQDPIEAMKEFAGMDYDQFNAAVLAKLNGADPVRELRTEIDSLKKSQEENTNKQYEATLKQYKAEAESLVSADPKAFHMINKGKHSDVVVQHIVDTWQENPDLVLTVSQAAKEVEEVLRENAKAQADALKELEPPTEEIQAPAKKTLPPPKQMAPRTLTQQVETAPPARIPGQFQHLSMKERIAQAVARAQR